jgi:hypothetical protein
MLEADDVFGGTAAEADAHAAQVTGEVGIREDQFCSEDLSSDLSDVIAYFAEAVQDSAVAVSEVMFQLVG